MVVRRSRTRPGHQRAFGRLADWRLLCSEGARFSTPPGIDDSPSTESNHGVSCEDLQWRWQGSDLQAPAPQPDALSIGP